MKYGYVLLELMGFDGDKNQNLYHFFMGRINIVGIESELSLWFNQHVRLSWVFNKLYSQQEYYVNVFDSRNTMWI